MFARAPVPGAVKTRLGSAIGEVCAARLYRAMVSDTLAVARWAADETGADIAVASTPPHAWNEGPQSLAALWDGEHFAQTGRELGERMLDASAEARKKGAEQVVIIGSDAPDLPSDYISAAFTSLANADAGFGPSRDGGFYLFATSRQPPAGFFDGVTWSSACTLAEALKNARALGWSCETGPLWDDVDTRADLIALTQRLRENPGAAPATREALADLQSLVESF